VTTARLRGESIHVARGGKAILRGVDVEVAAGEVLAVVGPSGAGKSTLFRALVGELPFTGRVLLDGDDVSTWPLWARARAGIGYVPQSPSVLWSLSVRGNLTAFHRIAGGDRPFDAEQEAARFDLAARLDVPAGELSAGERRRLEVARALVRSPRVLVCDEPFAGVDPVGAARIAELLRALADDGVAILVADHHVAEALALADRATLLLDGTVATTSDPLSFQQHPLVQGRYLGSWARTLPPPEPRSHPRPPRSS
jgi:lipopolysaccharide export system ATP-binding protein